MSKKDEAAKEESQTVTQSPSEVEFNKTENFNTDETKGYVGIKVDPEPNSTYTVAGVLKSRKDS